MLEILEGRIEAARSLEQDDEVIQGLQSLYTYMRAKYDRNTASPALQLLDTVLNMMDPEDDIDPNKSTDWEDSPSMSPYEVRDTLKKDVATRLQMAFQQDFVPQEDVLSVAQYVAKGGKEYIDQLVSQHVKPEEFIFEVERLLQKATEQQNVLEEYIVKEESTNAKHELEKALRERNNAIENVQEILLIARSIQNKSL